MHLLLWVEQASELSDFFISKVEKVRSDTTTSTPLQIVEAIDGVWLNTFNPVTAEEVRQLANSSPNNQSLLYLLSTRFLKATAGDISPFLTNLFHRSFTESCISNSFREIIDRQIDRLIVLYLGANRHSISEKMLLIS